MNFNVVPWFGPTMEAYELSSWLWGESSTIYSHHSRVSYSTAVGTIWLTPKSQSMDSYG